MRWNPHPTGKRLVLGAIVAFTLTPAFSQEASSLPPWLRSYPGATPTAPTSDSVRESSNTTSSYTTSGYTTAAQSEDVVEHYRTLFAAAGLPFRPNFDGIGTSIRGEARECDLLIQIRSRPEGTVVKLNCSPKTEPSSPGSASDVRVISSQPQSTRVGGTGVGSTAHAPPPSHRSAADFMQMHQQKVAEMGIHREHHDAPAPPLVWPSWLVHVNGAAVRTEAGVDQSKNAMLKARYTTNAPMTEIYSFYRELLNSHEYQTRSSMSTGQTTTGVVQNALGYVEGSNYPDGSPGAYTEIHVSFDRSVLNGPITVTMRFTTHAYLASRGY